MRIWHGRHAAPLFIVWIFALVMVGVLRKVDDVQPGLSELVRPIYWIVLGLAVLITWKWFRARADGREHDRRRGDRRHTDRRDDEDQI